MAPKTVREQIALLMARATYDPLYRYANGQDAEPRHNDIDTSTGIHRAALRADAVLMNETALAVRKLMLDAPAAARLDAPSALAATVSDTNAAIVAALVVDLGLARAIHPQTLAEHRILRSHLAASLRSRPRALTDDELDELAQLAIASDGLAVKKSGPNGSSLVRFIGDGPDELREAVDDVRRFRLRASLLLSENPAVDRDRRELLGRLERLSIADEIRNLLDLADRDAECGDAKGGLDKLRAFLERVCEECDRICARDKTELLPEAKAGGSIGPWLKFATGCRLLSQHEVEAVKGLYTFLSMEGSHAPFSTAEQFRVARTNVIEWSLLMAGRALRTV